MSPVDEEIYKRLNHLEVEQGKHGILIETVGKSVNKGFESLKVKLEKLDAKVDGRPSILFGALLTLMVGLSVGLITHNLTTKVERNRYENYQRNQVSRELSGVHYER